MASMNNNHATKVGEIFAAAGTAFSKLGELTMQLHGPLDSAGGSIWTDEEMEMMKSCVLKFGDELETICDRVKTRGTTQRRVSMKKRTYDEMGMPLPTPAAITNSSSTPPSMKTATPERKILIPSTPNPPIQIQKQITPTSMKNSEVTLNMLNASDGDVESLNSRLDFDASSVTS